jgi:hypothetical protein
MILLLFAALRPRFGALREINLNVILLPLRISQT